MSPRVPTEHDLEASVELLAFMWIALGNDPSTVRPHERLLVRVAIAQNFELLPADLQALLAQGRLSLQATRGEWLEADEASRVSLRHHYRRTLNLLGLLPGSGSTAPVGPAPRAGGFASLGLLDPAS